MQNHPAMFTVVRRAALSAAITGAITALLGGASMARAQDVSAPVILQWFDGTYASQERRMADVFAAGYGAVWTPPPGRADSGNQSVGYDVYDRFDLGSAGNPTLYGTATGIKSLSKTLDRAGIDLQVDFVINHNGFRDRATPGFEASGGYPGFWLGTGTYDGDFNSPYASGDIEGRLAGLIDINHRTNNRFVRNPVPGFNNVPAGQFTNIASESNRQFYTDTSGPVKYLFDPMTGESNIPVYDFNLSDPMAGDPVEENAMGYLMRNAQWLIQVVGVDGLRIDAGKHVEGFALDYFDRAVFRANNRPLLDGSQKQVFSYSEVYDGNANYLLTHVKKNIDPNDPGRIGGNRDTLDFKLYFALKAGLDNYGTTNAWQSIKDASLDFANDGIRDGDAGVAFVGNHDTAAPNKLNNVAHAYVLMMPGNATVYYNAKEHGDGRDFPKDGRGDALSVGTTDTAGATGSAITKLVGIRNTHGRGNYAERWVDDQGLFIFERESSAVIGLSNRGDGGFDEREVRVGFAPGTHLLELTGNAADGFVDPNNDIPEVTTVYSKNGQSYAKIRVPRNFNANGGEHGKGYVVYGLATPQSANGLQLSNVNSVLGGDATPVNNYENATQRQRDVFVLKGDTTRLRLNTNEVRLLGLDSLRDIYADGDKAVFKVDGGLDFNGNNVVDYVAPGSVTYGFEDFATKNRPLIGRNGNFNSDINAPRGDGEFLQDLDLTKLSEGYHFIEARAFRHRTDGGPAVFSEWKQTVYVDRLKPVSSVLTSNFNAWDPAHPEDRDMLVQSTDGTADSVYVFSNLGAALSDAEVLAMVGSGNRANQVDRDLFKYAFFDIANGNNAYTVVTYEVSGTYNVQRFTGINPATGRGHGLGDLSFDGYIEGNDLDEMLRLLRVANREFNPAADLNADGLLNLSDWFLLGGELTRLHDLGLFAPNGSTQLVSQGTLDYYASLTAAAVPEPASFGVFATFAASVTAMSRRRRAARPSRRTDNPAVESGRTANLLCQVHPQNTLLSEVTV